MNLSQIKVAAPGTHHVREGKPLYQNRFESVLKFHNPGLAPVRDSTGAYHITLTGNAAYVQRFQRTFGFYEGLAAVVSEEGWHHIHHSGDSVYPERYTWCGNFQEGLCPVRDQDGCYSHINQSGMRLSTDTYQYVGDFKDGIAVVCCQNGLNTHIDSEGLYQHNQWFQQLDVYHKGFARAKDANGWFHIDLKGQALYAKRYTDLEPFYNGVAHATDKSGQTLLINEEGEVLQYLSHHDSDSRGDVSSDLVGFWKSELIRTAVESHLLDHLPANLETLLDKTDFPEENLLRFLRALAEAGIVDCYQNQWLLSDKGQCLVPTHSAPLAASSVMWNEVQTHWKDLKRLLKKSTNKHHLTFKEKETNQDALTLYQRAFDGYAHLDFQNIGAVLPWYQHTSILGLGRASVTILPLLLEQTPHLTGCVLNAPYPFFDFTIPPHLNDRLTKAQFEPNEEWPPLTVDGIVLPRYLHYFPDEPALHMLKRLKQCLLPNGKFYIFEMILSEETPAGGLLDINMLVESGGGLRTLKQWQALLSRAAIHIESIVPQAPHLDMIVGVSDG